MIDLTMHKDQMQKNAKHCKERGIKIPTFAQMKNTATIPDAFQKDLKNHFQLNLLLGVG